MKYLAKNSEEYSVTSADMDYHFQNARKLRSAQAHLFVKGVIKALVPSIADFKTRYVLALTRTA